jgi:hypothetical protein
LGDQHLVLRVSRSVLVSGAPAEARMTISLQREAPAGSAADLSACGMAATVDGDSTRWVVVDGSFAIRKEVALGAGTASGMRSATFGGAGATIAGGAGVVMAGDGTALVMDTGVGGAEDAEDAEGVTAAGVAGA